MFFFPFHPDHPFNLSSIYGGVEQFSLAAAWLAEALKINASFFETSPALSVIERNLIKLLGELCGFKEAIDGLFCPGDSVAAGYAIHLARQKKFPEIKARGLCGSLPQAAFVSDQGQGYWEKMCVFMGQGQESLVKVPSNEKGEMQAEELSKTIESTKMSGKVPYMVVATAGTSVLGAFDPIEKVAEVAKKNDLWLHVDVVLGTGCLFSQKHRSLIDGIAEADSVSLDFSKMLSLPLYCNVLLVKNKTALETSFPCASGNGSNADGGANPLGGIGNDNVIAGVEPTAAAGADGGGGGVGCDLTNLYEFWKSHPGKTYDTHHKSIQCTRKDDALKLYIFLKAHGRHRLRDMVDNAFEMARTFETRVAKKKAFKLVLSKGSSNTVCFTYRPDLNEAKAKDEGKDKGKKGKKDKSKNKNKDKDPEADKDDKEKSAKDDKDAKDDKGVDKPSADKDTPKVIDRKTQLAMMVDIRRRLLESGLPVVALVPVNNKPALPYVFRIAFNLWPIIENEEVGEIILKFEAIAKVVTPENLGKPIEAMDKSASDVKGKKKKKKGDDDEEEDEEPDDEPEDDDEVEEEEKPKSKKGKKAKKAKKEKKAKKGGKKSQVIEDADDEED